MVAQALLGAAGEKGISAMSKPIPSVRKCMSSSPYTIGKEQTLSFAHQVMREHRIRHLPVLEAGKLVGIVSERDLHLIETLRDVNPSEVTVEDAMSQDVYTVSPDAPLDEVVREMAAHKYGSVVVVENDRVVGVFTTIDAMGCFAELLAERSAH